MPLVCGVLGIPPIRAGFSPPAASPNLRRKVLHFLRDEVSAVQALHQPLGLFFFALFWFFGIFFFLFLMLLLCIFHNFFRLFFLIFFVYSLCGPLFWCVHYGETGSSPPAGVIVMVMMITVLLRRKPQAFIKRNLNPSGQKKKERVQILFSGVHIIENLFRTQSSFLGLWQIGNVILVKQDYQIGIIEKMRRCFLCDIHNKKMHTQGCTSLFRCMI